MTTQVRGLEDLFEHKIIRISGDAKKAIKEDPIIMLRTLKYYLNYKNLGFTIEESLAEAIRNWKPKKNKTTSTFLRCLIRNLSALTVHG